MNVAFNAWGIIFKGGAMMWPIFILSIAAISIAFEKYIYLNLIDKNMDAYKSRLIEAIKTGIIKDVVVICEEKENYFGLVFKAGVLKTGSSLDVVQRAMEQNAIGRVHELKKRMGILSLITNTAPLLGLVGTISGMCVVFHAVQMRSNALNPLSLGDMSSGIWQALLTSAAGLIVGIMSFALYSFCAERINDVIVRLQQDILEVVNTLQ